MQKLIIMQGVPGSGKSTRARQLARELGDNTVICATDDYFMVEGVYKFDGDRLADYHCENIDRAKAFMNEGKSVIVDNTNIEAWECQPYVLHALALGIEIAFIRVEGNFSNTHNVPFTVIAEMRQRMQPLDLNSVLAEVRKEQLVS